MDNHTNKLFNNGINSGDITIVSNDGNRINCHSSVIDFHNNLSTTMSSFREKQNNTSKTVNLDYEDRIIIIALNKLYSPHDIFTNLDINDIMELIALYDYLQVINLDEIKSELIVLFKNELTKENWPVLFNVVTITDIYEELVDVMLEYYYDNIMRYSKPNNFELNTIARRILDAFYDKYNGRARKPKAQKKNNPIANDILVTLYNINFNGMPKAPAVIDSYSNYSNN